MTNETAKQRYLFLDLLKVIALLFMPCIHMLCFIPPFGLSAESFPLDSLYAQFGAIYLIVPTVFLFCMGASLVLTKVQTPKAYLSRGLRLLLTGFLLNAARSSIYLLFGVLGEPEQYIEFWYWLWCSDVLYFDGLFFMIFALMRKLRLKDLAIAALAVVMAVLSHLLMPVPVDNCTLAELFGNFVYVDVDSCFPILSWTVYPVAGYLFMKGFLKVRRRDRYVLTVGAAALAVFIGSLAVMFVTGGFEPRYLFWGEDEFIMDIPSIWLTLSFLLAYVCAVYFIAGIIKNKKTVAFIARLSANVQNTYLIHWVIVMYSAFVWKQFMLDVKIKRGWPVYAMGIMVFAVSALLAEFIRVRKTRKRLAQAAVNV